MKRLLLYLVLLAVNFCSRGQGLPGGLPSQSYNGKWQRFGQYVSVDSGLFVPRRDTNWRPMQAGALTFWQTASDSSLWNFTGVRWTKLAGGGDVVFNGNRPITRDFSTITGVNLGTTTTATTLSELLYPNQPPTATLTGGQQIELMATGAGLAFTLNWSAGRQTSTSNLSTITVAGQSKSVSQPAPNTSVSGTQAVSVPRNVTTTYSNVVTTIDGKSATASTTFSFGAKDYRGWVSSTNPTDAELLSTTSGFTTSKTKSWIQAAPTGQQNLAFAYPASLGFLADITINGFPSIQAFEFVQRNVTNASGFLSLYNIYVSTNKFNVTGTTSIATQ